jgi:hypothetical protein
MQWNLSEVLGYRVNARNGRLGFVTDLYVDDIYWEVRYLVVTGDEQAGARKFLLAPEMISRIDREIGWLSVFVSTAMVRDSPPAATGRHLFWSEEHGLRAYDGLSGHWPEQVPAAQGVRSGLSQLHSLCSILGSRVLAGDNEEDIGPLLDLVFDDSRWAVHSLEVDASCWLPAGRFWIRSSGIRQVRGSSKQVVLGLPLDALLTSPTDDQPGLLAQAWAPSPWRATYCAGQLQEGGAVT